MTATGIPQIFDRRMLRQRRARVARDFARHRFLHHEIAERLLERRADVRRSLPRVLELGCADGIITQALRANGANAVATDCTSIFLDAVGASTVVLDDELLPFAQETFDLIISNLHLHTVNDLPGLLAQCRRILAPDGLFLASMLGGSTLWQLRQCLYEAETAITGGVSPRVAPFITLPDAAGLLQRAGFALPVADSEAVDVIYPDAMALLRDLRGMGFGNVLTGRLRHPTRRAIFAAAAAHYAKQFPAPEGGITAVFEVIYWHGWAPKRGTFPA